MTVTRARRPWPLLVAAALLLDGCGSGSRPVAPLGRSFSAQPDSGALVTAAPAPRGDPLPERGGTIPAKAVAAQQRVTADALAASPAAALRRYALAYANWTARELRAREYELAELAIGQARQVAQQTVAAGNNTAPLVEDDVANPDHAVGA